MPTVPTLYVPDEKTRERLHRAAERMGIELRPLPTLEEWHRMFRLKQPEET